jgi:hypothetical protein
LNKGTDDSNKTDKSSNSGGMPQMPQMPQSPDMPPSAPDTADATPAPPTNPQSIAGGAGYQPSSVSADNATACAGDNAYLFDVCTSQLVSQCGGNQQGSSVCANFTSRYCTAPASATSEASPGALVAGEGVGSSYCSGTSTTPSSLSSASSPAAGGFGSSGSTGGGAVGASLPKQPESKSSDGVTPSDLPKLSSLATEGGGGGGGSSYGGENSSHDDYQISSLSKGRRPTAMPVIDSGRANATDVGQRVQSVFTIATEVLLKRCLDGRLMHCDSKRK